MFSLLHFTQNKIERMSYGCVVKLHKKVVRRRFANPLEL